LAHNNPITAPTELNNWELVSRPNNAGRLARAHLELCGVAIVRDEEAATTFAEVAGDLVWVKLGKWSAPLSPRGI